MTISRGTAFDAECLIRVFHRRLRDKKYPQGHVAGLIEGQPTSAQASFVAQRFVLIESSAIVMARAQSWEREGPKFVAHIETAMSALGH